MKHLIKIACLSLAAILLTACTATETKTDIEPKAEKIPSWPTSEPEITSALFSRTSLTVRSIDESLKLYEGVFGMAPFYNRPNLDDPRLIPFSNLNPGQKMNLTVLRIETDGPYKVNSGYLGLTEIVDPDGSLAQLPELTHSAANYGAATVMILVPDILDTYEQVKALGYEVISAPKPKEEGGSTQLLMRGPNGERIWVSQTSNHSVFLDPNRER